MIDLVHIFLFIFLVIVAIAVIRLGDLFAAVMLSGIFSLLAAGLYTVMDAVDVAFTEAAVGAGISTVFMLAALSFCRGKERPQHNRFRPLALLVACFTGAGLIYGTLDMPAYGSPDAPIHHHMAPRFVEESPKEIGVPNMVTSVLASYRGYDTWGETTVILTAAIGVMLLLGIGRGAVKRRQNSGGGRGSADEDNPGEDPP